MRVGLPIIVMKNHLRPITSRLSLFPVEAFVMPLG
jgi:hypothetical protein